MKKILLHTPDGVKDIYGIDCVKRQNIEKAVHQEMYRFGYRDIQTPTFEFFDIFREERGSVSSRDMFKFFDKEGNTLVLRPDITPSIARCVAKYYGEEDMPLRFCYSGNTFYNTVNYQGKLKEVTQLGAELIGDDTIGADAEMIACVVACLQGAGLTTFQIEVGHVGYFYGLMEEAALDEEDIQAVRTFIENKNYFGLEEFLCGRDIPVEIQEAILQISEMFGSMEQVARHKARIRNGRALEAIAHLEALNQVLEAYGVDSFVSYDLAMIGRYRYYSGIVFQAFTYGTGEDIAAGGRYDSLLAQFGKSAPSVGFAITLDPLILALERQNGPIPADLTGTILLYEIPQIDTAIGLATVLRGQGEIIRLMQRNPETDLNHYMEFGRRDGIGGILYIGSEGREVQVIPLDGSPFGTVSIEALSGKEEQE